ncbi:MAG: geranylgeranylglyceryl/heptaprenylglyceryl phosphate synthase [Bacteroidetes bacterium]|nr:geranylgeranylglyceryl/heptaprenylglyceryl phosphate synthase [Bacteroidota bacterium]
MNIYQSIIEKKNKGQKQFAVLIDPDKPSDIELLQIAKLSSASNVDYFFVGGSLLTNDHLEKCILTLKEHSDIPVVLFPGNNLQINKNADAILLLSLISGRNAEMLIGKHVIAAPYLKESGLEIIPTGYMLIDSGKPTTVTYMSNTFPIPADKDDIAACTAMAGEMLGLQLIYMDAGSGALNPISTAMISNVRKHTTSPIVTGGGIKSPEKAIENCKAGVDIIVVGNAIEKTADLIKEIGIAVRSFSC